MSTSQRPTISLCLIAKNEEKNIRRLFSSIEGCFDEIILVDTGSTDKTVEIAKELGAEVHHFKWINSFSAARNFAFSKATKDYIMWLDLDDALNNKEGFIQWRDYAMEFNECYFATYNYALDADKKPIIKFVRERVFKRCLNPVWQYDLHEGIILKNEWSREYCVAWTVDHMRDVEDINADKSRNIKILEEIKKEKGFDSRLKFYYGKELYEASKPREAVAAFEDAIKDPTMEFHDRLLAYQYAAYSCFGTADQLKEELVDERNSLYIKAIDFASEGIKLDPNRAEYHVICGDSYLRINQIHKAIPYYAAAKNCINPNASGSPYEGAIYSFVDCYGPAPTLNLSKIYFNLGKLKDARREAVHAWRKWKHPEAEKMLAELSRVQNLVKLDNNQIETEDIVFTTPPQTAYPFDEELYKTKGMGGSETALIQMAKYLKKHTDRNVIVFNQRADTLIADSGVEYRPNSALNEYFSKYRPKAHIAWRHNIKITHAPTYLWCHDLVTSTVESVLNADKLLCLSPFHKNYVMAKQGVSADKIVTTRNGVTPEKFDFERLPKNKNKLVWMSSPDRGLDKAMLVCDEVKKEFPDIELHVYYGLDNLYKYGLADLAKKLEFMMSTRPYVKYHGFTEQSKMYKDVSDAVVWVHPCNFIETFCITALEMLILGVYPVTRRLGALADTLGRAQAVGMATMLDHDCVTDEQIQSYATEVKSALRKEKWKAVSLDSELVSWEMISHEWIKLMNIEKVETEAADVGLDEDWTHPVLRTKGLAVEHSIQ